MTERVDEPAAADACTAVLLSVPQQVAERIASFLATNGIACRIRLNTEMTPERLAEEYLKQSPEAAGVLEMPLLGPLLRGRLGKDLKAEIKVTGSEIPPVWDVLVRPEDLPEREGDQTSRPARLNVPLAGLVEVAPPVVAGEEPPDAGSDPGGPEVLCELPWDEAWALTERLIAAGIPAAVMAAEEPDRDRPMAARIVPVGVRPEDVERARSFVR